MTKDQASSVQDDIAYMKSLAQEAGRAPQNGGSILFAAGIVFGAASVFHYLMQSGVLTLPPVAYAVVWLGALLVFFATLFLQVRRIRRKPGAKTVANRAVGEAWMGVGLAIFAMSLALNVLAWKTQSELLFLVFPSLILALYGSGWAVSAAMSGQRWQWFLAIGGWAGAPLLAFLSGSNAMWLGYAAGLVLLALVPGWVLMRAEPKGG